MHILARTPNILLPLTVVPTHHLASHCQSRKPCPALNPHKHHPQRGSCERVIVPFQLLMLCNNAGCLQPRMLINLLWSINARHQEQKMVKSRQNPEEIEEYSYWEDLFQGRDRKRVQSVCMAGRSFSSMLWKSISLREALDCMSQPSGLLSWK